MSSTEVKKAQRRKKLYAVKMMGGKCQICGYDRCINALEFHHPNEDKAYRPTYVIMRWSWDKAKEEIKKCMLLCANCHREIHYKEIDTARKSKQLPLLEKTCKKCGKGFTTKRVEAQYCSLICSHDDTHRCERPTKEVLYELLSSGERWRTIGKRYGVSDNAVKKWARKYEIPTRSRDYKNMIQ